VSVTFRPAKPADAELIQAQRDAMFTDMGQEPELVQAASAGSLTWLRGAFADGRYGGVLAEQADRDGAQQVVAGAGVLWQQLPPSPTSISPVRAYILNVYVAPQVRGQGLAKILVQQLLDECRRRGIQMVTLHASDAGRPTYAALGFDSTAEMQLKLEDQS
jgi:ribosomal protein S18 acetylase RimI-like enzyme